MAGFLPLSPSDASLARLPPGDVARAERFWGTHGGAWRGSVMSPLEWNRARVRPANHPIARLSAGAALIANARAGLLPQVLTIVRDCRDSVAALRTLTAADGRPGVGDDRAQAILASGIVPFALALAEQNGDTQLHDATSQLWERLPGAAANEATRRALRQVAGEGRLRGLGGRGQQGLIHLDQTLCAPRRCFECPIAAAVLGGGLPG
ncbi:MAG: hypothetical protein ACR2OO_07860 [Thermomicrobiales bacterium]